MRLWEWLTGQPPAEQPRADDPLATALEEADAAEAAKVAALCEWHGRREAIARRRREPLSWEELFGAPRKDDQR